MSKFSTRLPSLQSRLVILALALLVPALAAAGLTLYASYRNARKEVEKHLQETSRALSLVVDRQFGQAEALLWSLSVSPQLRARDYAGFDALAREATRLPGAWVLVEEPGRQVVNTRLTPGSALPVLSNQDHWTGLAPGQIQVSNLFTGLVAKRPAVALNMLLVDPDGSQRFLSVIMLAETFSQILADQSLPATWAGAILDRKGTIVARSRDPEPYVGKPATKATLERLQAGITHGVFDSVSLDGTHSVIGVAQSPASGWSTIVAVPRAELTGGIWRLALYLASAGGLLTAAGAALAFMVARRITRPVKALVTEVQALGRGEMVSEDPAPSVAEFQETATLRTAFVRTREALRLREQERDKAYEALRTANATLESRVESRTQELARANASLQESQAVLAEREALYASVFRFNADGLFVVRIEQDGNPSRIEAYNSAIERVLGRPVEEAAGRPLAEILSSDHLALIESRIRECLEKREPITYERQGTVGVRRGIWTVTLVPIQDKDGRIARVLGTTRDITGERDAEAEIRESRDRYSTLFEHSPLDLAVVDVRPDGGFVYEEANSTLLQSIGFAREAFIGHTPHELFPSEAAGYVVDRYRECVSTRAPVEYEVSGRAPVGEVVRRTMLVPLLDGERRVHKIFVTSMDLTEQRRMEERLRQAQRLETVGQLTGGIAHDFNNLLTVVMGNLDMLRRAKPDRAPRLIDNALAAVEQGRSLTSQLLAFSRRQPLKPDIVDLGQLVGGMRDMLAQSLRGDIVLEIDAAEGLWPVEVDPTQLQAALINLAANARDAMPRGGTFRIRAQNRFAQHEAMVEGVAIQVSDNGTGISPEDLARVFEPFFTTKPVGQGTGLGLAQVYGFVQQSGGHIDIMSEPGRGTVVTLVLPRASRDRPAPPAPSAGAETKAGHALRILLVEDNLQVAELAEALLTEQGHRVVRAATAPEALAVLRRDAAYDLVFSDLVMPGGMDGLELARTVRKLYPAMPILLATGYSAEASRAQSEGYRLLSKPYQPAALTGAVRELTQGASTAKVVPLRPSQS
ncbi:MAG TPA: PAS domain-containing protein [Microvirga sp.]|jgi:PAS domain S-box-containing protein|nr:PAS domain-containing protein [Microvirga sp.]